MMNLVELYLNEHGVCPTGDELDQWAVAEIDRLRKQSRVRDELNPSILAFAYTMQHKLDINADKDGKGWPRDENGHREGWHGCSKKFLREKLIEEVGELLEEVSLMRDVDDIRNEAADVGNIAMMLADVCLALEPEPEQSE